ncbi:MAG: hypothetical protein WC001_04880 [Desulfurivibrionaceae bacterium]
MIDDVLAKDNTTSDLNQYVRSEVPGLQYIAVTADRVLFEYAGGWADIHAQRGELGTLPNFIIRQDKSCRPHWHELIFEITICTNASYDPASCWKKRLPPHQSRNPGHPHIS